LIVLLLIIIIIIIIGMVIAAIEVYLLRCKKVNGMI